jgi:hypothetical protein
VDKLGNILPRVIAKQPNRGRIVEARVRSAFAEVLGAELAAMCESIDLRGKALTVVTSSPALSHQLRADGTALLARLNALAVGRTVERLQVRTGRAAR